MTEALWHPFPQEKPKDDGFYLVTTRNEITGTITIDLNHWGDHKLNAEPEFFPHKNFSILAWTELPVPFSPPVGLRSED